MTCKSTAIQFKEAKLAQFKNLIDLPEAKQTGVSRFEGIMSVLKKANYRIERVGSSLHCQKGRAVISFDGKTTEAMVTLLSGPSCWD